MKRLKKLIKRLFLLTVVVIVIAGCVLAGSGYKMYRDALNHQGLESKVAEIQSNPSYTTLSEMPELYLDAVVAVEDHRFEQHLGIDLIAIGRAAWNNLTSWSLREGGSTITQQLAKICISHRKRASSERLLKCLWRSGWKAAIQKMKF